tara:strand:+ start:121 stop:534 length:414 start_codon:yes stop_codon:yes gene_type:complete
MTTLNYGRGICSVEGHISSINITYLGAIIITSKLPSGCTIEIDKNILRINSSNKPQILSDLFSYYGEFKISLVQAKDLEGENVYVTVNRYMDYSELIHTKSEDLTIKSEDLNSTYIHGRVFKKSRIIPPKDIKRKEY